MERQMIGLVQAAHRYYVEDVVPSLRCSTSRIPDTRGPQGVEWNLGDILSSGVLGKLTEMRTLRQVEVQSDLASANKNLSFGGRRLPDSTAHPALEETSEEAITHMMGRLAGRWHRDKKLSPVRSRKIRGRDVGILAYDGQEFGRVDEKRPTPYYRKSYIVQEKEGTEKKKTKRSYWTCGVVHAVLTSGAALVCIGQKSILKNDENGAVLDLDRALCDTHRWLSPGSVLKLADAKHGTTGFFRQQGDPYNKERPGHYAMVALKGTQKLIYQEVKKVFDLRMARDKPEATSDWEDAGHGREVMRQLWRAPTNRVVGLGADKAFKLEADWAIVDETQWSTIYQVVVVKQTTRYKSEEAREKARSQWSRRHREGQDESVRHVQDGDRDIHYRYFIVNVKPKDVAPEDLLFFVRKEWEVEVFHNQLVQLMHLKARDWVTSGQAPVVIAGLSAIALNFLGLFRHRRLREDGWRYYIAPSQLLQLFMVVVSAGALQPLLEEKARSRKTGDAEQLDDSELMDLVRQRFTDRELELLVFCLKQYLGRLLGRFKARLTEMWTELKELGVRIRGAHLKMP